MYVIDTTEILQINKTLIIILLSTFRIKIIMTIWPFNPKAYLHCKTNT